MIQVFEVKSTNQRYVNNRLEDLQAKGYSIVSVKVVDQKTLIVYDTVSVVESLAEAAATEVMLKHSEEALHEAKLAIAYHIHNLHETKDDLERAADDVYAKIDRAVASISKEITNLLKVL